MTAQSTQFKNLIQVLDYFKEEETCRVFLVQQRWGGKPCCPHCGHDKVYTTNRGYKCADKKCYKKFSVITGTVMENTKIKLRIWMAAMYLITAHKRGVSSYELSRDLNISQKTAWFLNHRIREMFKMHAPDKLLEGVVQSDESFFGGKNKNRHADKKIKNSQGRSFKDKTPIMGLLDDKGTVRTFKVANTEAKTLLPILQRNVAIGTTLMTDEWLGYSGAAALFNHKIVNHGGKQYVSEDGAHCNGVENYWSIAKRTLACYYHFSPKHIERYMDETTYRFNTKHLSNEERFTSLATRVNGRLKYRDLISN